MLFRSKPVACVLLLLTLSGAWGPWHATDDHDADAQLLLHDHRAHHERLGTPAAPVSPPTHCALCHWLRTFGTGAPRGAQLALDEKAVLVQQADAVAHIRMSDRLDLPSRAPPLA